MSSVVFDVLTSELELNEHAQSDDPFYAFMLEPNSCNVPPSLCQHAHLHLCMHMYVCYLVTLQLSSSALHVVARTMHIYANPHYE